MPDVDGTSHRALLTYASGPHVEYLHIAEPSFQAFADRHGYDLVVGEITDPNRPGSWLKIPLLKAALQDYDEVLWVDADVVIVDPSEDLGVPPDAWQALVRHRTGDGDVPNCGVWLVRKPMLPVLDEIWAQTHLINHGFWEQSALMHLLGFRTEPRPCGLLHPSGLYEKTHWLDHGWNVHKWDTPGAEVPRFLHATMHEDRAAVMRAWAAGRVPGPLAECGHRYTIKGCLCDAAMAAA